MKNAAWISAFIYTGISLLAAALFVAGTLPGNFTWIERFGGAFWVFLLSMIILMPIIIPAVRRRIR